MLWIPPPGTIGLATSYGLTQMRASFGRMLVGDTTEFTHAFIVLDGDQVMEACPSGARVVPVEEYEDEYVAYGWPLGVSFAQREAIASAALSLDGVGYGLVDYAVLAASRRGSARALARVARAERLVPAQFVAEAYRRAGLPLLDGRPDVSLEDLGNLLLTSSQWGLRIPAVEYA